MEALLFKAVTVTSPGPPPWLSLCLPSSLLRQCIVLLIHRRCHCPFRDKGRCPGTLLDSVPLKRLKCHLCFLELADSHKSLRSLCYSPL